MKAKDLNKTNNSIVDGVKQCVYVIENQNGKIKIGRTKDFVRRVRSIETQGCIEIIRDWSSPMATNAAQIERDLHKFFGNKRVIGEWFDIPFEDAVKEAKSKSYIVNHKDKGDDKKSIEQFKRLFHGNQKERIIYLRDLCQYGIMDSFYFEDEDIEGISVDSEKYLIDILSKRIELDHYALLESRLIWEKQEWGKIREKRDFLTERRKSKNYSGFYYFDPILQQQTLCSKSIDNILIFIGFKILEVVCVAFKRYRKLKIKLTLSISNYKTKP